MVLSAQKLNIVHSYRSEDALEAVRVLVGKLPPEATIKLSLLKEGDGSGLYVYSRPLVPAPDRIGLLMESPASINEASPLAGRKTHNYLENILVLDAAHAVGCYDALRLNSRGRVAEGAISNLFFVRDGVWHTPNLSSGLLPGVMREALLQVLEVEQGEYLPEEVFSAEALFVSNATIGLQPVDWMCSGGKEIVLSSRKNDCYGPACQRLAEFIGATAIQF
jgi:branched-subunit amino acid aminotransferase/4-amino-4-deoxychorismate lyase